MRIVSKIALQWIVVFSVAIIVIMIWTLVIIPESEKLTDKDLLDMEYAGQIKLAENVYGNMTQSYFTRDNLTQEVINKKGNEITIRSTVSGIRSDTHEELFHITNIYHVDAITQMHIDKKDKKFGFTPGVEKKDYQFFHPATFFDAPLIFEKIDIVNGLDVYVFDVITKGGDVSDLFPQFVGHVVLTDSITRFYVEPITGNVIKFEKEWNHYLVEDGKRINTVVVGKRHTTEFTEKVLSEFTVEEIENIRFNTIVMPILLISLIVGIGTIWILLTYMIKIKKESAKQESLALIGDMTARLSHDLRNPLTIIKNGLELNQLKGISEDEKNLNAKRIQKAVDRMEYQIESIMNFVRNNPLHSERISLRRIINATIENIQIPKEIEIEQKIPDITMNVDFNQIVTVFSNIITNSIEATKQGKITIIAKVKTRTIEIEFIDSGPGIPKDKLDKIFEPLFTTKIKGTGLGLASCKSLIEKHNGRISVKNNPTTFTVTLPK